MVISTVSLKGGAGKTTLAINLAVYFANLDYKTVIIDSDVNGNIERWNDLRPESAKKIDFAVLNTPDLFRQNFDEITAEYEIVIIDGRPAIDEMCSFVLSISDIALLPIIPSPLDLWTNDDVFIDKFLQVKAKNKELKAMFVMNRAKPNTNLFYECKLDLIDYFNSTTIRTCEQAISDRQIYAQILTDGLGVTETKGAKQARARAEFNLIGDEVMKVIKEIINA